MNDNDDDRMPHFNASPYTAAPLVMQYNEDDDDDDDDDEISTSRRHTSKRQRQHRGMFVMIYIINAHSFTHFFSLFFLSLSLFISYYIKR